MSTPRYVLGRPKPAPSAGQRLGVNELIDAASTNRQGATTGDILAGLLRLDRSEAYRSRIWMYDPEHDPSVPARAHRGARAASHANLYLDERGRPIHHQAGMPREFREFRTPIYEVRGKKGRHVANVMYYLDAHNRINIYHVFFTPSMKRGRAAAMGAVKGTSKKPKRIRKAGPMALGTRHLASIARQLRKAHPEATGIYSTTRQTGIRGHGQHVGWPQGRQPSLSLSNRPKGGILGALALLAMLSMADERQEVA